MLALQLSNSSMFAELFVLQVRGLYTQSASNNECIACFLCSYYSLYIIIITSISAFLLSQNSRQHVQSSQEVSHPGTIPDPLQAIPWVPLNATP